MIWIIKYIKINIKKLLPIQIVICTFIETIIILLLGMIFCYINKKSKVYIPDYVFIIVTVENFVMVSVIKKTNKFDGKLFFEIMYWLKLTIFSLTSYIYIIIILQIPFIEAKLFLFNNLKCTTLITMVLMVGMDFVLDSIYQNDEI